MYCIMSPTELCTSPASSSTSTITVTPKSKAHSIDSSSSSVMASKRIVFVPSSQPSTHTAFRPSPLNPTSPGESTPKQHKRSSFPASRPLRPFPSISQSLSTTKMVSSGTSPSGAGEAESKPVKPRAQKPIELSSKWTGGFIVLGMTQAEFSRQDS